MTIRKWAVAMSLILLLTTPLACVEPETARDQRSVMEAAITSVLTHALMAFFMASCCMAITFTTASILWFLTGAPEPPEGRFPLSIGVTIGTAIGMAASAGAAALWLDQVIAYGAPSAMADMAVLGAALGTAAGVVLTARCYGRVNPRRWRRTKS